MRLVMAGSWKQEWRMRRRMRGPRAAARAKAEERLLAAVDLEALFPFIADLSC
jgi:hypothetical protein